MLLNQMPGSMQPVNMVVAHPAPPKPEPTPAAPAPATRSLIEDTARRVLTKESKAIARAAKKYQGKPDEFRQWAETWYTAHAPLVTRVFTAPLKAAALETTASEYATRHCAESLRMLTAALDSGGGLDDVTDEFESIRPGEIAQQLLTQEG